jgi:hypothetical protein
VTTSDPFGRSPLHPLAVSRDSLAIGVELIRYNRHSGERTQFSIHCSPYQKEDINGDHAWFLKMANLRGEVEEVRLADLGIVAYPTGRWHRSIFTVRTRDISSLPEPTEDDGTAFRDLTFLHPPTSAHQHQHDPWYDTGAVRPTNWQETMAP